MKQIAFLLVLLGQLVLAGCSKPEVVSASATIRVTIGNPPRANADEALKCAGTAFESYDFSQHANQTFGLAKLWSVSDMQVFEKLSRSILVHKGSDPDSIVVQARGLDHDLAVKILNDLCAHYSSMHTSVSSDGGQEEDVHVSVMEAAK